MIKYTCDKCLQKVSLTKLVIKNNKLICPFCSHTLETDRFKVNSIKKEKEETYYEDKSTNK